MAQPIFFVVICTPGGFRVQEEDDNKNHMIFSIALKNNYLCRRVSNLKHRKDRAIWEKQKVF